MSDQYIHHIVVDTNGAMVPFYKNYLVLQTTVKVDGGRNNYAGVPVAQSRITFTHIVSMGEFRCLNDNCGFRGSNEEAVQHTTERSHSTTWDPERI